METLDFTRNKHDWWSWFMIHNKEAVDPITNAEGFDLTESTMSGFGTCRK